MSVYKVLISCSREVPKTTPSGHSYMEDQRAYAEYQYFSTPEKARGFVQRYSEAPLEWDDLGGDIWSTKTPFFEATIFMEKDAHFDTALLPPLPTKFAERHQYGD